MPQVTLHTHDGVVLHAEYAAALPPGRAAAVLAHPHPQGGGDMHSPVPAHLFEALPPAGIDVLRFDFRGAGGSGGQHAGGTAEVADLRAAAAELHLRSGRAVWLVGWSFGADVSLHVDDPAVAGWVAVAPTFATVPGTPAAAHDPRPVVLLVPEHDQFAPPAVAAEATAGWTNATLSILHGADHFLAGRMDLVTHGVLDAVSGC